MADEIAPKPPTWITWGVVEQNGNLVATVAAVEGETPDIPPDLAGNNRSIVPSAPDHGMKRWDGTAWVWRAGWPQAEA